jgi:hypothetical protein
MLLKLFIDYPYIVYSIIALIFILFILRWEGIKQVYPASIIGAVNIFAGIKWLTMVGLYKINITLLPVFGVPFFLILWGALSAMVFAYYLRKSYKGLFTIVIFSGLTTLMEMLVELYKRVEHLAKFNNVYEFIYDIFLLSTLAIIMIVLFPKRVKD